MKTTRVLVAGGEVLRRQCSFLKDFINSNGGSMTVDFLEVTGHQTLEAAVKAAGPADVVRADPELSQTWLLRCPVQPIAVSLAQAADLFFFENGTWHPYLLLERAIHDVIVRDAHSLDFRASAYAIGNGAWLRIIAGVALSFGFRKVFLVGENAVDLVRQQAMISRAFMGAEIVRVPVEALTLQPSGASFLINGLNLEGKPEISEDLAYFNFMQAGGVVIDLWSAVGQQNLLDEAKTAELRTVSSVEIDGQCEVIWMNLLRGWPPGAGSRTYLEKWIQASGTATAKGS